MLRIHLSISQDDKNLWKQNKPCHIGIHWKALAECYQMSTNAAGFQSYCSQFFFSSEVSHQQWKVNICVTYCVLSYRAPSNTLMIILWFISLLLNHILLRAQLIDCLCIGLSHLCFKCSRRVISDYVHPIKFNCIGNKARICKIFDKIFVIRTG